MKKIFFIFFLIIAFQSNAQKINIESLRNDYYKVDSDSSICSKLYTKVKNETFESNVAFGYKGAIFCAMAGYSKNKQEKFKLFNEGKKQLEQSIKNDSTNLELRFLRLTIQLNCPKALGYGSKIETDKKFLLNNIHTEKNSLVKKRIVEFLLNSNKLALTEAEKKQIKN